MDVLSRFITGIDYDAVDAEEQEEAMINSFKAHYTGDSIFAEELSITPCNGYPEYILDIFLANMIYEDFDMTVQRLVAGWNQETFKLELRPVCKTWRLFSGLHLPIKSPDYVQHENQEDSSEDESEDESDPPSDGTSRFFRYGEGIERIVLKLLLHIVRALNSKDGTGTSIRCLDLSEFLFQFGSSAVFDIINEECRSNVCSKCDQPHALEKPRGEDCCCESCNRLTIKTNLHLRQDAISKLRSLLTAIKDGETFVDLIVTGWAIRFFIDHEMMEECLNSLKGLGSDNVLTCSFNDDEIFYSFLTELPNIKQLDLSGYNTEDWEKADLRRERFLSFLPDALKDVHHLESLYFNEQLLTDNLQSLLGGIGSDFLQHLQIANCCLSKADLTFLAQSVFAESLKNLYMSYQTLDMECLEALFAGCKNLAVLEMVGSSLGPENAVIDDLFRLLTSLQNLKFLNISDFEGIDPDVVLSKVKYIGQMPNLKCIRMKHQGFEPGKEENDSVHLEYYGKLKAALEETGIDNTPSISIIFTYDIREDYWGCGACE